MTEAMENAQSIFDSMSDYAVGAYIKAKQCERLAILRDEYNMGYGASFMDDTSNHLLFLCNRYALESNL